MRLLLVCNTAQLVANVCIKKIANVKWEKIESLCSHVLLLTPCKK